RSGDCIRCVARSSHGGSRAGGGAPVRSPPPGRGLRRTLERGGRGVLKRAFDVLLSGTGLVISAPLWLVIAAAIKLEDGGPVLFPQDRVGLDGATFRALKFRSMVPHAATLPPHQAGEADPRITRVGRLLRATAMDELPQLFNIFRGDMSFVGPRPLVPGEIEVRGNGDLVRL